MIIFFDIFIYLFVFVFGMIIGSFLNVCIYRLPREQSVFVPPSGCTVCGYRIKTADLLPVFSYILLQGKCRHCGAPISDRYPLVELLTGAVYAIIFYKYSLSMEGLIGMFLMSILIAVFFIDLEHKIIPDELVVVGLIGCLPVMVYNFLNGEQIFGEEYWANRLLGLLPGTGILLIIALVGFVIYKNDDAMGMGDVKLFAPIGLFLGWKLCMLTLVLAVVTAGIISVVLITGGVKKRKDTIPFGPFIVIGTFVSIMWGTSIINWYIQRIGV